MDAIVVAALEEACVRGASGVPLPDLWRGLRPALASSGLHPCEPVKKAVWSRLLSNPGLRFAASGAPLDAREPSIQSLDEAERMGVSVVAEESLRDSFLGIDDLKHADGEVSKDQRRTLERLALARTNGIAQCELAKEFGIHGNHIFYIVRNLECQQLVVRRSTTLRTKESEAEGENGPKATSTVHTNLIHLYRYAKNVNLNSQQRIEITRPHILENLCNVDGSYLAQDGACEESVKEDMRVKDFLPAMKAVCDKLDETNEKVLIVSNIKRALGYRETHGHRAWRNILNRLKDAGLVEEFMAKAKEKDVSCLRLVKKFDPKDFEQKPVLCGYDDFDRENSAKHGKRGQITDQLVELPIDHRIYDMIDAEGCKGITVAEASKRLGIGAKKMYNRIVDMRFRFALHMLPEVHKRTKVYRVWTAKNYRDYSLNIFPCKYEELLNRDEIPTHSRNLILCDQSSPNIESLDCCSINDVSHPDEVHSGQFGLQPPNICPRYTGSDQEIRFSDGPQVHIHELEDIDNSVHSRSSSKVTEMNASEPGRPSSLPLNTSKPRASRRHPSLVTTVVGVQREQRILERLKNEKFVLTVELHRWLEELEKERSTMMDKKTLIRILNKLQKKGLCKCCEVIIPGVTNCSRTRKTEVILHPSVNSLSTDLLDQIHEKQRLFDMQSRGRGSSRSMNDQSVAVITDVKGDSSHADDRPVKLGAMYANGFVSAKMVRAKLLHNFLWGYIISSPDWPRDFNVMEHSYDQESPRGTCQLFALDTALKAMPLELFLQVVGSPKELDGLIESCRKGLRLSDFPVKEYKHLMDTQAIGRLSGLIDILIRLKLIRLVTEELVDDVNVCSLAVLTHAIELKPYIEEPLQRTLPSSNLNVLHRLRHSFILSSQEAVNEYWETLEYCYAAADQAAASDAFPGSAVREVFQPRSWASVRVMTVEQRMELLKRVTSDDPGKKIPFKECVKIARELNLTLEQVLRVSYDRNQSRLRRYRSLLKSNDQERHLEAENSKTIAQKRKQSSKDRSPKHAEFITGMRESDQLTMSVTSDGDEREMDVDSLSPACMENYDCTVQKCKDDSGVNATTQLEPREEDAENSAFINQCAVSWLKPMRRKRFSWTDNSDRQLVAQYAKHRAMIGTRFNRVLDWASIPDLPALPDTCRRRISMFKKDGNTRKSLMRLCNLLGQQYAGFLDRTRNPQQKEITCHVGSGQSNQDVTMEESLTQKSLVTHENTSESSIQKEWDDFEDPNIKAAIDEVLQYKRMIKMEYIKMSESTHEKEWPDISPTDGTNAHRQACATPKERNMTSSGPVEGSHHHIQSLQRSIGSVALSGRNRSHSHHLHGRFLKIFSSRGFIIRRQVRESLAVANAVELIKLVFIKTSTALEVQTSLLAMLQLYSARDICAAFNYLKEKEFVVIGHGSQPFVLSQMFWNRASSSPFPVDTGKRATNLTYWLSKQEKDLTDGVDLNPNLQCGEVFHLFALVSSGELCILPSLPKEGVGEDGEPKNLKRKGDKEKLSRAEKVKKHRTSKENDDNSCYRPSTRRGKGFPGIKVTLKRAETGIVQCVTAEDSHNCLLQSDERMQEDPFSSLEPTSCMPLSCNVGLYCKSGGTIHSAVPLDEVPWDALTSYAEHLSSNIAAKYEGFAFSHELFKSVYSAIHQAGDQGLNMVEVSEVMFLQGLQLAEIVVDTLEAFQLAVKVNAYDDLRVVDSLYRSKYFLSMLLCHNQDHGASSYMKSQVMSHEASQQPLQEMHVTIHDSQKEACMSFHGTERGNISNLPKEAATTDIESEGIEVGNAISKGSINVDAISVQGNCVGNKKHPAAVLRESRPILPWISGDGSVNATVYKGLTRRVLGIVMQNPGIMEEDIIRRMDVLNPQSCRQLLEILVLDNHIIVRTMHQTTSAPPCILENLFGSNFVKSKSVVRKHFFANPMSTYML